jgi:hypothetical protein
MTTILVQEHLNERIKEQKQLQNPECHCMLLNFFRNRFNHCNWMGNSGRVEGFVFRSV